MATDPLRWHIGFVGYGEVGRILAEDETFCHCAGGHCRAVGFDRKTHPRARHHRLFIQK